MNLTVNIPDEEVPALKAQASGLPLETFVEQVVLDRLHTSVLPSSQDPRRPHIAERIREIMKDVPPEVMATMPTDGASQHDHYIYGWPKSDV
jgi:hypothetical protein